MLHTYHIHIKGLVQGVGFRPFVCRLAEEMNIDGWVNNTTTGVYIEITTEDKKAATFYNHLIGYPPENAIITQHYIKQIEFKEYTCFTIRQSKNEHKPDILLMPDISICQECKQEINDPHNKRYGYAFTTCLNCGPRYSIIKTIPYDRENTTMAYFQMCSSCLSEYNDIKNRRHYSQTNSCKECAVKMHLYTSKEKELEYREDEILNFITDQLKTGKILAIKSIGGYLLMCDATNKASILTLRNRKQRPSKPFALLYASIELADADVLLRPYEIDALKGKASPIVLCRKKLLSLNNICMDIIAPGLDKIGVMLPCSPLLSLIADKVGKPLIATSGNISGSPIIYKDEDALENLFYVADFVLTNEREIVIPQDDSVIQFTNKGQKIILRRSRGMAPNYFPNPFKENKETILATGGELKSAFAFLNNRNLYISQYLGDQGTVESQESYGETLKHLSHLLQSEAKIIITDKHPAYFVSQIGRQKAKQNNLNIAFEVQHHKAHFGAVLAENNLSAEKVPVLGFIWDGSGYGEDKQIWGSEVFLYQHKEMDRVAHLAYFPYLLGDKMSKEPRLSALSMLRKFPNYQSIIQKYFSVVEWDYYQKILKKENHTLTSSMGRFLDGLACILNIRTYNSYEGEAAMQMEAIARSCTKKSDDFYSLPLVSGVLDWTDFLLEFLEDYQHKKEVSYISWKVFYSLAKSIEQISHYFAIDKLAFSGGVFQNALLTDLVIELLSEKRQLFFHQQLSPNDECIGFGQLACYKISQDVSYTYPEISLHSNSERLT